MNHNDVIAISKLYDASVNPGYWNEALDLIAPLIGAKGSALLLLETLNNYSYSISQSSSLYSPEIRKKYEREYAVHEQVNFSNIAKSSPGKIIFDADYIADPVKFRSRPDVKFILENTGVFERFGVRLNGERAWFDCITFQYDHSRGNITSREKKVLKQVLPHLAKATEMSRIYNRLRDRYNAVLSVLDKFRLGVFIVTPLAKVVLKNSTADEILSKRDGFYITSSGSLKTNNESLLAKLNAAIQSAAKFEDRKMPAASEKILMTKLSRTGEYLLDISPLNDIDREVDSGLSGALVTIVDTEANEIIKTDGVSKLYNLSKSEAIVCDMLRVFTILCQRIYSATCWSSRPGKWIIS